MSIIVPDNARYEIKFVTHHSNLYQLKNWFKLHHAGFEESFSNRWINNIYFDSNGHNSFVANIYGMSSRAKIRYRWYGDQEESINGALEIKKKRNFRLKQNKLMTNWLYYLI